MGSREKELYTLLRLSFKLWLVFSYFLESRNVNIDVFFGIIISDIRKSCLSHKREIFEVPMELINRGATVH